MTSMKLPNFQNPLTPVHLPPKCFYLLDLGRPILKKSPTKPPPALSIKPWKNNRTVHMNE